MTATPPELLRQELHQLRERGLTFGQAWPVAQSKALGSCGRTEAVFWRRAWSEQRAVWGGFYSGVTWRRPLAPGPDREGDERGAVVIA